MHLNTLSNLIEKFGLDNTQHEYRGEFPEIIFHSPFWPIPVHRNGGVYVDHHHIPYPIRPTPDINYQHKEVHSDDSNSHAHKGHEKALCRIYDWNGNQIPFDNKWRDHPCFLVVPKTPDSKLSNSANNSTPEDENASVNQSNHWSNFDFVFNFNIFQIDDENMKHEQISYEEKIVRIKNKGRNVLKLKTRTCEVECSRIDSKRRRKDKKSHKNSSKATPIDGKCSLISHFNALSVEQWKEEVVQSKNLLKSMVKVEVKDDGKSKSMACNCKRSRCLKFYWEWLAAGRMWTPECNCWDWANNELHIGKN